MDKVILDNRFTGDVEQAVTFLREQGCSEIYLFESLAQGNAGKDSDIDIAVRGIEPSRFFNIYGQLMMLLDHAVDLVDLDLQRILGKVLAEYGELLRVE